MIFDTLSTLAILAFITIGLYLAWPKQARPAPCSHEAEGTDKTLLYERLAQTLVFDRRGYDAPPLLEDTQQVPDLSEETALPEPPVSEAEWQAMEHLELMEN